MTHDLDQLLRERLDEYAAPVVVDEQWLAGVISQLEPTTIRNRRIRFAQASIAAAAASVVVVVVVVAASVAGDNGRQSLPADTPPTQSPDSGRVVDVQWGYTYLSDPVTFDDMAENLREHGLGEWVEPLHEKWGDFDGQIVMAWDENGEFSASIPGTPVRHTPSAWIARGSLCFEGSDSCLLPTATELDSGGQRLRLTLGSSNSASTDGIPGEVYERALFTTVSFNEIPSPASVESPSGTYQSDAVRFDSIASWLDDAGLNNSVERLRQQWGTAGRPDRIRLELDGDTATLSIPGTPIAVTGPFTTDGSLLRIEDAEPRDDNGWIELAMRTFDQQTYHPEPGAFYFYKLWDAGPALWDGALTGEEVAKYFLEAPFTPTGV